jgi:hypothetical protein
MALPAHVVAPLETPWLGHSPLVAAKHDLQSLMRLTDAHFEVAIRGMARVGEAEAQAAPIGATTGTRGGARDFGSGHTGDSRCTRNESDRPSCTAVGRHGSYLPLEEALMRRCGT